MQAIEEMEIEWRHQECLKIDKAVDDLSNQLKKHLHQKVYEGKYGWDEPKCLDYILNQLRTDVKKVGKGKKNIHTIIMDVASWILFSFFLLDTSNDDSKN